MYVRQVLARTEGERGGVAGGAMGRVEGAAEAEAMRPTRRRRRRAHPPKTGAVEAGEAEEAGQPRAAARKRRRRWVREERAGGKEQRQKAKGGKAAASLREAGMAAAAEVVVVAAIVAGVRYRVTRRKSRERGRGGHCRRQCWGLLLLQAALAVSVRATPASARSVLKASPSVRAALIRQLPTWRGTEMGGAGRQRRRRVAH